MTGMAIVVAAFAVGQNGGWQPLDSNDTSTKMSFQSEGETYGDDIRIPDLEGEIPNRRVYSEQEQAAGQRKIVPRTLQITPTQPTVVAAGGERRVRDDAEQPRRTNDLLNRTAAATKTELELPPPPQDQATAAPAGYTDEAPSRRVWTSTAEPPVTAAGGPPKSIELEEDPTASNKNASNEPRSRPWGLLAFCLLGLFFSIGGNMYLGWIAWDTHARYQDIVDDLHETETQLEKLKDRGLRDTGRADFMRSQETAVA